MNPKIRAITIILCLVVGTALLSLGEPFSMQVAGFALNAIGGWQLGALTAQAEGL